MRFIVPAAALVSAIFAAAPASAQTSAISLSNPTVANSGTYEMGYRFTVNAPITVVRLGAYDVDQNGLGVPHTVSLWSYDAVTGSGTLITSIEVPAGTQTLIDGGFRYVDIAPQALTAGSQYVVAGSNFGGTDIYTYGGSQTIAPQITYNDSRYAVGSASIYPTLSNGTLGYFGGSFQFVDGAVPEPASWALMIGGFALAGMAVRRRRITEGPAPA